MNEINYDDLFRSVFKETIFAKRFISADDAEFV